MALYVVFFNDSFPVSLLISQLPTHFQFPHSFPVLPILFEYLEKMVYTRLKGMCVDIVCS